MAKQGNHVIYSKSNNVLACFPCPCLFYKNFPLSFHWWNVPNHCQFGAAQV